MPFRFNEQTAQVGFGLAFKNRAVTSVDQIIFIDGATRYAKFSPVFAADKAISQRLIDRVHNLLFVSVTRLAL